MLDFFTFGGTGRRDGLKIHSSHGGVGSTPTMSNFYFI